MPWKDISRRWPGDVRAVVAPILPPRGWCGNRHTPDTNPDCLHAPLSGLAPGIAWEVLPPCVPPPKAVQRRLRERLARDCFHTAWRQLAQRHERRPAEVRRRCPRPRWRTRPTPRNRPARAGAGCTKPGARRHSSAAARRESWMTPRVLLHRRNGGQLREMQAGVVS
jgi:hypothetical protein